MIGSKSNQQMYQQNYWELGKALTAWYTSFATIEINGIPIDADRFGQHDS